MQMRIAARHDPEHLLERAGPPGPGPVEIGQCDLLLQLVHHAHRPLRGRVYLLAREIDVSIVQDERDIGGDHDHDRRNDDPTRRASRAAQAASAAAAGAASRNSTHDGHQPAGEPEQIADVERVLHGSAARERAHGRGTARAA